MKLYQLCIAKMGFFVFYIFAVTFNPIIANRSSMVFINESEAIYNHNSMLFKYDLKSHKHCVLDCSKNGYFDRNRKRFADVAISSKDDAIWSIVKNCGEDYIIQFVGSQFVATDVIKYFNNVDGALDNLFLSQDAGSLVSLRENWDERSILCFNLLKNKVFELNKALLHDILSNEFRTLDMTNDGTVVVLNVYKGGGLYIWQPEDGTVYSVHSGLGGEFFHDFALSPDGVRVLSISANGGELWNVKDRRFEYLFRWDNNSKNLETYSCPPKIDGWAIDSKIYYRSGPNFYISPDPKIDFKDKSKAIFMWGSVRKAVFSPNSRFVFLLTELKGYFEGLARWHLNIFDIQQKTMIQTIELSNLTDIPDFMTPSPDMCQFLIMCRDGEIVHIPVNLQIV